jgi:hypothetical protein
MVSSRVLEKEESDFLKSYFEAFNRALMPFKVFVQADSNNETPPLPVQKFVAKGIRQYLEGEGSKSLDECFGLKYKRGDVSIFSKWKKYRRDMNLCQDMIYLRKNFGLTIEKAAYMVSKLPNSLTREALADCFKKNGYWKSLRKTLEPAEWFTLENEENRQNFLKRFPYHSLPDRIKPLHPEPHT